MNLHLDCPGCGRLLRVNRQFAGRTVRCPSCGTPYVAPSQSDSHAPHDRSGPHDRPAPEIYGLADNEASEGIFAPADLPPPAESVMRADGPPTESPPIPPPIPPLSETPRRPPGDGPPCPECGEPMAGEAVVCLVCGFNRATGKRLKTVSRRLTSRWDAGNFPLVARLVVFFFVVAACGLPLLAFAQDPEIQPWLLLIPVAGAALGGLALGTFHRVTVTTDPQGTPILVQNMWICFVPSTQHTTDLTEFRTIRLTHREGFVSAMGLILILGLCLLGGVMAILLRMHLMRNDVFTLEIVSRRNADGEPLMEPLPVYFGRSERMARGIGDALEQIAGLRYG